MWRVIHRFCVATRHRLGSNGAAADVTVPGCTGATVMRAAARGLAPKGMPNLTAYQPGSDTAMILASWIMPAGEQIVSDGPASTQKTTQLTISLSSPFPAGDDNT